MRDSFGSAITFTLFGESHGPAIGGVLHGVAPGVQIDEEFIATQMDKRRAKGSASTKRHEADKVTFLSGVKNGFATGTAIAFCIENANTKSKDYDKTANLLRPGHADYTAYAKYKGFQDVRGGGHFSGRLTAPIVTAGSIFLHMLQTKNVKIATHMLSCACVQDAPFSVNAQKLEAQIEKLNAITDDFAVIDKNAGEKMMSEIIKAADEGDSVGGVLETCITGLPPGIGEPFFSSMESVLAQLLFSMPAVKGVEFGTGFAIAGMRASTANDSFYIDEDSAPEKIMTRTNNNGGINGGITNGMPIILRTAIKPTPSIYKKQQTVDFATMQNATLQISGRHDPCIVHRARVVQDSLVALGIADVITMQCGTSWQLGKTITI